jgi:hypothetical protein
VGLLMLHGLNVNTQSFVGLADGELLDCRLRPICVADADGITKFAAL